jgi:hypothetical protein
MFMKKIIYTIFAIFLLSCFGCKKEIQTAIQIRIKNNTQLNFEKVFVMINDEKIYYNINPNKYSEYQKFNVAYRYAYIKVVTSRGEFVFQPYDYVGETPLSNGKHTYILTLENQNLNITYSKF